MNNKTQKCPKCGEENPAEAVMCWACYTPLSAAKAHAPRPEPAPADEKPTSEKIKRWLSDAVPYTAVASSIASGWLPRKMRLPVLGASASALLGPMLLAELKHRLAKDKTDVARNHEGERSPSVRIAETILFYAWKEKVGCNAHRSGQSRREPLLSDRGRVARADEDSALRVEADSPTAFALCAARRVRFDDVRSYRGTSQFVENNQFSRANGNQRAERNAAISV